MWHKKKGKLLFLIVHPPLPALAVKFAEKRACKPSSYPQGCPGDARFPGVIHLFEEVLGIIHLLHPVVFMLCAHQEVWVRGIGEEVLKTGSPRYCEHGLSLNCTWRNLHLNAPSTLSVDVQAGNHGGRHGYKLTKKKRDPNIHQSNPTNSKIDGLKQQQQS